MLGVTVEGLLHFRIEFESYFCFFKAFNLKELKIELLSSLELNYELFDRLGLN